MKGRKNVMDIYEHGIKAKSVRKTLILNFYTKKEQRLYFLDLEWW